MNRKINSISNISAYPGLYFHVYKSYITTDMSAIKIYNKKEKKYALYFFIKLFVFSFLIWVLQCSDNLYSSRSWNYDNDLKNVLNLGAKRLLAEKVYKIGQGKEKLKFCEQKCIVETELEQRNGQEEIEKYINEEQESEIEEKNGDEDEVKYSEKTLGKHNINPKSCSLYSASILSFASFILFIIYVYIIDPEIQRVGFLCINLSILIFSVNLIMEEIKTKLKGKLQLSN
ncbi:fam-h protein [Plasmodium relictum]|uniref:Fam-h protein n=1 Tax=Plasmodium relictum TaxID=85471 RepID=A0A1J1GK41_PLARL|nr:fam-h protein [Plasmodium relictum]CRG84694.1 fam-h protein [Plasmodium relictum]